MTDKPNDPSNVTDGGDNDLASHDGGRRPWVKPELTELSVSRTYVGTPGPNDGANPYT